MVCACASRAIVHHLFFYVILSHLNEISSQNDEASTVGLLGVSFIWHIVCVDSIMCKILFTLAFSFYWESIRYVGSSKPPAI